MGVPGFFSWLLQRNKNNRKLIISNTDKQKSCLFIDANCLLHPNVNYIIQKVKREKRDISRDQLEQEIYAYMRYYINDLISKTNAKMVYIAIDGVAPMAKILQQRQRRYKYYFDDQFKIDNIELNKEQEHKEKVNIAKFPITSIELTPGTPFMKRIHNFMIEYVKELNSKNIITLYSSFEEEGEGEHKLIQYIKQNCKNDKIIVYGLDADLLFLTLSVDENLNNQIFVMREKQVFQNTEIDYDKEMEYNFVDITELHKIINNMNIPVLDFIILCYVIGNDFLPHIKSVDIRLGGLDKIINAYVEVNKPLYINNKIDHDVLLTIFNKLVWTERWDNIKKKNNYSKELNIDDLKIEFKNKSEYYNYYLGTEKVEQEIIIDMVKQYITGFDWCIEYYTNKCKNWSWGYSYLIAPLITDIVDYYPLEITIENKECELKPIEQLLFAIPQGTYKYVIDQEIINKIKNSKEIGYLLPESFDIEINKDSVYWKFPVKIPLIGELEYREYITHIKTLNL